MIDAESLRCFAHAARLLSFNAAARAVSLSPAAFGQRIRQLEVEVGAPLFHRTTRVVVLTEAGYRLVPAAQHALDALESCRTALTGTAAFELTVGTRHELAVSWLRPALHALESSWPGSTLHLYIGSGEDLLHRVRQTQIDCAVASARIVDRRLVGLPLHEERYVLVGPPRLLSKQPLRTAADAARHTLFDIDKDVPLFRYLRDAKPPFDSVDFGHVIGLGSLETIFASVLEGRGVAVLPRYFVQRALTHRKVVELLARHEPRSDFFRLVFRADDPRRSLFERLAHALRERPLT